MRGRWVGLFWSGLALSVTVHAVEVHVHVSTVGPGTSMPVALQARPLGYQSSPPPVSLTKVVAGGEVSFDLSPGSWSIESATEGLWSPPLEVTVSATDGPIPARLAVWPAATLTGRIAAVAADAEFPDAIEVSLQHVADRDAFTARVSCPVSERAFACRLPSTTLDLGFGADGFSTHYLRSLAPSSFESIEVNLVAGPSIVGRVVGEGGQGVPGAEVRATFKDGATATGRSGAKLVVQTDRQGHFQFVAAPTGELVLEASATGLMGDRAPVSVNPGVETRLRAPLRLSPPRPLRITVHPARDPLDRPWLVELRARVPYVSGERAIVLPRRVVDGDDGTIEVSGLRLTPGPHTLRVHDAAGRTWFSQPVEIGLGETSLTATIEVDQVRGVVLLGDRPLVAKLTFGGEFGAVRIPVETDAEGRFETSLPVSPERWDVLIVAQEPRVRRAIVAMPEPGSELEIALPDTRLAGRVLAPDGSPYTDEAVVEVSRGDFGEQTQWPIEPDDRGRFELVGFEPGEYSLRAEAASGQSKRVQTKVRAEGTGDVVALRLDRHVVVRGSVSNPEGEPLAGVRVKIVPANDPVLPVPVARSNAHGHFEASLPVGTSEVFASAGGLGFALKVGRFRVLPETPLNLRLSRAAGVLKVRWRSPLTANEFVNVYHGGGAEQLGYLRAWAAAQGVDLSDATSLEVPAVEAGRWWACRSSFAAFAAGALAGPAGRCADGLLAAGSDLVLDIPEE